MGWLNNVSIDTYKFINIVFMFILGVLSILEKKHILVWTLLFYIERLIDKVIKNWENNK